MRIVYICVNWYVSIRSYTSLTPPRIIRRPPKKKYVPIPAALFPPAPPIRSQLSRDRLSRKPIRDLGLLVRLP